MPIDALTPEIPDCPPADAVPAEGIVFRASKNNPPAVLDMQTHHETGRLTDADPCLRKALSVFVREREPSIRFGCFGDGSGSMSYRLN